jgi:hypothetical protein
MDPQSSLEVEDGWNDMHEIPPEAGAKERDDRR